MMRSIFSLFCGLIVLNVFKYGSCQVFTTRNPFSSPITTRRPPIVTTNRPVIRTVTNTHQLGGTLQQGISTSAQCLAACQANINCRALDFNGNDNTCWFHMINGVCGQTRTKTGCTHRVLVSCDVGRFVLNGARQINIRDAITCVNSCARTTTCQAVDFNSADQSCWFHTATTACNTMQSKTSCTHYKRVVCTGTTPAVTTPAPSPTPTFGSLYFRSHIRGGVRLTTASSLVDCINACTNNCRAIDFNTFTRECYVHSASTACSAIITKDLCFHFKRFNCP